MEAIRKLDITNADHIIYKNGMLDIVILGGIRLEGLDRMRVTLKIQIEHQAIRHKPGFIQRYASREADSESSREIRAWYKRDRSSPE